MYKVILTLWLNKQFLKYIILTLGKVSAQSPEHGILKYMALFNVESLECLLIMIK